MDRNEHLKRFRGAALFLLVMIVFTMGVSGLVMGSEDAGRALNSRYALIFAGTLLVPALMAWNGSLLGAGALFGLLFIWALGNAIVSFTGGGIGWPFIRSFLYLGVSGWLFRELYLYRRKSRAEGEPIGGSATIRWGGKGIVAAAGGLVVFGLTAPMLEPAQSPVLTARQIPLDLYYWMYDNDILGTDERVFLFSRDTGKPYSESGNLLTNQYVGSWWQEDGKLETGWIRLGEICRVEKTRTESDVQENLYTLHTFGEDSWLRILLPKRDGGEDVFLARMNYLNDQKMHHEVRSACDEDRMPDWDEIAASNGIQPNIIGPKDMRREHISWLRHNDYLTTKERLLKFYSHGHYSIATGGLLLTDQYFGGWSKDTDGLESWWFKFGEICSVKKEKPATKKRGPRYRVISVDDNWFQFNLPNANNQDEKFIALLNKLNQEARTDEQEAACTALLKAKAEKARSEASAATDEGEPSAD